LVSGILIKRRFDEEEEETKKKKLNKEVEKGRK